MNYNQLDAAIAVMREVAKWGREKGFRVWLDEWLTPEELLTDEAKPENFCIGEIDGKIACAFILQRRDSAYWNDSSVHLLYKPCIYINYVLKENMHIEI